MNRFTIKKIASQLLDKIGILNLCYRQLNAQNRNNYIRVVNYHTVSNDSIGSFENQLQWYSRCFENVDYKCFQDYLNGKIQFTLKPGIMITFDDGYEDNYTNAYPLLNHYSFSGYFFVSSNLIGTKGYMTQFQLKDMIKNKHFVGCHTATHHRMSNDDTNEILEYEILQAKNALQNLLSIPIEMFCWCGGEESTYTVSAAQKIIDAKYNYSFMTNSFPLFTGANPLQIPRTNIEADWDMALVKFQLCGIMDRKFSAKRKRINKLTDI